MRCPRCDANVADTSIRCNFCGQDLSVVHYVRRVSNTYYNMGLEKAQVRDLSGAVSVLKKNVWKQEQKQKPSMTIKVILLNLKKYYSTTI